ncbi:MAG: hypothetical protein QW040_04115 [Candidatus Aenigmatarchaeota archaeon]
MGKLEILSKIPEKELKKELRELIKSVKWRYASFFHRYTVLLRKKGLKIDLRHEYVAKDNPEKFHATKRDLSRLYDLMKEYMRRHGKVELFSQQLKLTPYAILDGYKYWFNPSSGTECDEISPVLNRKPLKGYGKITIRKSKKV